MHKDDENWNEATPQDIPHATYWPIIVALGITLVFWGILTVYYISVAGLLVLAIGIGGWISDLREDLSFNNRNTDTSHES